MNKTDARKIAETITNEQLVNMFEMAKTGITDWTKRSSVNSGMTKGSAWNVLGKNFDVRREYPNIAKRNMVWEFGDFLPDELKPEIKRQRLPVPIPFHQEPIFNQPEERSQ